MGLVDNVNLREPKGSEVRQEVGVGPKFKDISLDVYTKQTFFMNCLR